MPLFEYKTTDDETASTPQVKPKPAGYAKKALAEHVKLFGKQPGPDPHDDDQMQTERDSQVSDAQLHARSAEPLIHGIPRNSIRR